MRLVNGKILIFMIEGIILLILSFSNMQINISPLKRDLSSLGYSGPPHCKIVFTTRFDAYPDRLNFPYQSVATS